ncbi:M20 family metallo-hydrolase [Alteribacter natronophilus]|uniref:M20 family metallo-hydrolase n=1 Tax=Alteribacter natronophilus TaxID=2583810 RepID=UPI00110E7BC5|nr:M20 family metallo-hydrolase [Alteribacter natronophilus]TMW70463.1 M20 family metallo-hydrolase [Alteribacter natronophilus]
MREWLERTLKELNLTETMNPAEGFTRLSYTDEEWAALACFKEKAEELGLSVRQDEAGNVIARWEPERDEERRLPAVATGSHLDTVANGGGYDGAAGVLCALGAVKKLRDSGFSPRRPIEVICFASEESARFGVSTIGSKAMSGLLDALSLKDVTDRDGVTVKEAVESRGLNWDGIGSAERARDEIASFLELHIEQGMRVEEAGAHFGAVTAIACPIRLHVNISGKAGHTGTTPMNRRQDAFAAAAPLVTFVYERAGELSEQNELPIVATCSTVDVTPNVMNVIPGKADIGVDIRSVDDSIKEQLEGEIRNKCAEIEQSYDVGIAVEKLVHNPSVFLDADVHGKILAAGEETGLTPYVLESGAGHDVMNMQAKWPSGMIFIPCRDGLSHHPDEHADPDDLLKGVKLISAYLVKETGE